MSKEFSRSFYNSSQWKAVRREVLRRDHYTCAHCYGRAEEVHHVVELTPDNINDMNISLNPDNLLSLCHTCHTKITQGSTGDVRQGYVFDEEGNVIKI
jgi:5-methylcytosine-specific restriction endonuclease McrA